jgi:hypothetical protein
VGEELDVTGGKLTVTFSDSTTTEIDLTADMVSGFDSLMVGTQELTVTYKADSITLTATFSITVAKDEDDNTALVDDAVSVNIFAHGNTIVVENANEEVWVYDAMGKLVYKDTMNRIRTEITVNTTGVYIVRTGTTAKRVYVD